MTTSSAGNFSPSIPPVPHPPTLPPYSRDSTPVALANEAHSDLEAPGAAMGDGSMIDHSKIPPHML